MDTTYEAILKLNKLKAKYGIVSKKMTDVAQQRLKAGQEMMHRIDEMLATGKQQELPSLKPEIDKINMFPVVERTQLELPLGLIKLKPWRALWSWLTGR